MQYGKVYLRHIIEVLKGILESCNQLLVDSDDFVAENQCEVMGKFISVKVVKGSYLSKLV